MDIQSPEMPEDLIENNIFDNNLSDETDTSLERKTRNYSNLPDFSQIPSEQDILKSIKDPVGLSDVRSAHPIKSYHDEYVAEIDHDLDKQQEVIQPKKKKSKIQSVRTFLKKFNIFKFLGLFKNKEVSQDLIRKQI